MRLSGLYCVVTLGTCVTSPKVSAWSCCRAAAQQSARGPAAGVVSWTNAVESVAEAESCAETSVDWVKPEADVAVPDVGADCAAAASEDACGILLRSDSMSLRMSSAFAE